MSSYIKAICVLFFTFNYLNIYGQSYLKLGEEAYIRGDYKTTIENYLIAIKNGETGKEIYYSIGNCYFYLEDYNNAIKYLVQRLEIGFENNDSYDHIYETIIASYYYLNKIEEAKKYFEKAKLNNKEFDTKYVRFEKDGYRYLCTVDLNDSYYLMKSLKKKGNGIIEVWIKDYWDGRTLMKDETDKILDEAFNSEDWQMEYANQYEKRIAEVFNERNGIMYSMKLEEFDCINSKNRILEIIDYSKKGEPINNLSFYKLNDQEINKGWKRIVPDSVGEYIFERLCSK